MNYYIMITPFGPKIVYCDDETERPYFSHLITLEEILLL
jgi:hypothetical protein